MLTSVQFIPGPQVFVQKTPDFHNDLSDICRFLHIEPQFAVTEGIELFVSLDGGDSWDYLHDIREMKPQLNQLLSMCPD